MKISTVHNKISTYNQKNMSQLMIKTMLIYESNYISR